MNRFVYHLGMTRQELLRQAAADKLARQEAAAMPPLITRAARSRGGSHRTIRRLAAALRLCEPAPPIPSTGGQA
jgi:hypothetical protein